MKSFAPEIMAGIVFAVRRDLSHTLSNLDSYLGHISEDEEWDDIYSIPTPRSENMIELLAEHKQWAREEKDELVKLRAEYLVNVVRSVFIYLRDFPHLCFM